MENIGRFVVLYGRAVEARTRFRLALDELISSAGDCRAERDGLTLRLASERPDLVAALRAAYDYAQPLTDAMMTGGRWPEKRGTRYQDTLESIPPEHRSPEMQQCLDGWKKYADTKAEIERVYPPPPHFWWNGAELAGPNLFSDFGLTQTTYPCGDIEYREAGK